ncbi:Lecithin retinol acyltransferase [Aliiroseovarius crassostreae]|uniref:lecithin retinol acyltransferase family protein n=1 Tax=Aliiroseovarius crassostreae TaxID=154981 RepID=UPI0008F12A75|nr:lecithin retinol acyltransferase family protein [Aliiroseovarius crassostreae]SFU58278.1 Lecithin retinol acyltransferase [Aliiroseovarius crassostreae]
MNINNCPPGTTLIVSKPPVMHFGIYAGNGRVIDNSPRTGCVSERSLEDFSNGNKVQIRDIPATPAQGIERLQQARNHLGTRYNLLNWNCEQFVNFICGGRARSTQLIGITTGALLGAATGSSWRNVMIGSFAGLLLSKSILQN